MPRGIKRGTHRGNSHPRRPQGRHSHGSPGVEANFVLSSGTSAPRGGHNGFTLAEEARNTELHQSAWDSDKKLRYSKVSFVSAGTLSKDDSKDSHSRGTDSQDPYANDTSSKEVNSKDTESALADMSLDSPQAQVIDMKIEVEVEEESDDQSDDIYSRTAAQSLLKPAESSTTVPSNFIIDTHSSEVNTGFPPPRVRSPSPTSSDSSEEVILFRGRNKMGKCTARNAKADKPSMSPFDSKIRTVEEKIRKQEELLEESLHCKEPPPPSFQQESLGRSAGDFEVLLPPRIHKAHNKSRMGRQARQVEEEEAIIADYLANIDSEDREVLVQVSKFGNRELGGTEGEAWQDETEMSFSEPRTSKEQWKGGWDASNIEDLGDLSTSDGVMGEVQAIFSKRERQSGLQYLVVWENQTMDEARWVPATTLTSVQAQAAIEEFEEEEKLVAQFAAVSDEDDDDSVDSDDMVDEYAEDEGDLLQRKIDRMDDEQIARLLAKQEELGMGSNELLLFDDATDADEEDGFAVPATNSNPFMLPSSSKKARLKRPRGEFLAATALADAYDGFDVMDFERPSLKKKPKGRRGKLILDDISDTELEESMQAAWDNDRIKKKERKQEREALRAQGLLGTKNGKVDLKQKYKEGMGIRAVKDEIKRFLMGSDTTLALPPMDKGDRKVVHEIANAFNLKSKSSGSGKTRFPILYRTHRTSVYVESAFEEVEARLSQRFLKRQDVGWNKWTKSGGTAKNSSRTGGGFSSAAVSYRDGDVVGGSAPELGAENKGRAMLEKMGWSQGTALGALNNKGILQPVSHVVKTTKAGLG